MSAENLKNRDPEYKEKPLKQKAIKLIEKQYSEAADAKAHYYMYDSPGYSAELDATERAEVMQKFAVNLGLMTEKEAENLKNNYWNNRDKIYTKGLDEVTH